MPRIEYDPGHAPPDAPLSFPSTTYVSSIDEAVAVVLRIAHETAQAQARERAEREAAAAPEPAIEEKETP